MKIIQIIMTMLIIFAFGSEVEAKACKKGKPCGNSCISKNKICRIGTTHYSSEKLSSSPKLSKDPVYSSSRTSSSYEQTYQYDDKTPAQARTYTVKASNLHVRDRPSTTAKIIGVLAKGNKISVFDVYEDWGAVVYRGEIGWVNLDFLK